MKNPADADEVRVGVGAANASPKGKWFFFRVGLSQGKRKVVCQGIGEGTQFHRVFFTHYVCLWRIP